ncbi:MAG: NADH-quinone oxidoreductase subunit L [Chloroflexi bacterium]|nr:NADH-quinone oxidoreductase subunit L [Chloroflexota bacterium]
MPTELLAWPILLLPFLAFVVIGLVTHPFHRLSGSIAIAAILGSLVLSLVVVGNAIAEEVHLPLHTGFEWLQIAEVKVEIGLTIDALTSVMLVVVTLVSFLVQFYSQGYMHGDAGYPRYYAFISLFTFSMLGLILANNLLLMFMFWEGVGLCSYLLIGHWYAKPEAAAAAKKAFIVTRFGDLGFIIGFLILFALSGTFDIHEIEELAEAGKIGGTVFTIAVLGLFAGAVGKSAQFPLHVWLPDAMEGPTPVSALIHAATMVAAGVYLVARMFPLFEHAPAAMTTVAVVGGFTALFAATMGIVMNDIKKVMAYSTISQLGYMMLGLGVGSVVAGIFHLFTHAFFKALLFLGSGSVIHGTGTQNMDEMGGLRQYMPATFWTLWFASLSLAGIFPFAGFWSKDEILAVTFHKGQYVLFGMALLGAFITAFYVTRMMLLTFYGKYRGGPAHDESAVGSRRSAVEGRPSAVGSPGAGGVGHAVQPAGGHAAAFGAGPGAASGRGHRAADTGHATHGSATSGHRSPGHPTADSRPPTSGHHSPGHPTADSRPPTPGLPVPHASHGLPHESPFVMVGPLVVLAVLSVSAGWVNVTGWFSEFLGEHFEPMDLTIAALSTVVALNGIAFAILIYGVQRFSAAAIRESLSDLHTLVVNKYFMDHLYEDVIVRRVVIGASNALAWWDQAVVDRIVNLVARVWVVAGAGLRHAQTGRLQAYGLATFGGVFLIALALLIFGGKAL